MYGNPAPIRHKGYWRKKWPQEANLSKGWTCVGTIGVGFTAYDVCKWSDNEGFFRL